MPIEPTSTQTWPPELPDPLDAEGVGVGCSGAAPGDVALDVGRWVGC
jgi:hypothetical protein